MFKCLTFLYVHVIYKRRLRVQIYFLNHVDICITFQTNLKTKMKQLILVLAVHCLMYTANAGSTLPGKSLAETLIDSIPDSPRGSIKSYGVRLINIKK